MQVSLLCLFIQSLDITSELLVVVDCLLAIKDGESALAQFAPEQHEVAERIGFAALVADRSLERQRLIVELQRFLFLAQLSSAL